MLGKPDPSEVNVAREYGVPPEIIPIIVTTAVSMTKLGFKIGEAGLAPVHKDADVLARSAQEVMKRLLQAIRIDAQRATDKVETVEDHLL